MVKLLHSAVAAAALTIIASCSTSSVLTKNDPQVVPPPAPVLDLKSAPTPEVPAAPGAAAQAAANAASGVAQPYEVINAVRNQVRDFNQYLRKHPVTIEITDAGEGCKTADTLKIAKAAQDEAAAASAAEAGASAPQEPAKRGSGAHTAATSASAPKVPKVKVLTPYSATLTLKAVASKEQDPIAGLTGVGNIKLDLGYQGKFNSSQTQTIVYQFDTALSAPTEDGHKDKKQADFEARLRESVQPESIAKVNNQALAFVENLSADRLKALTTSSGIDKEKLTHQVASKIRQEKVFGDDDQVAAMAYAALQQLALVKPQQDACMYNPQIKATIEFDVSRNTQLGGDITLIVFKIGDTVTHSSETDNSLEIDFKMQ